MKKICEIVVLLCLNLLIWWTSHTQTQHSMNVHQTLGIKNHARTILDFCSDLKWKIFFPRNATFISRGKTLLKKCWTFLQKTFLLLLTWIERTKRLFTCDIIILKKLIYLRTKRLFISPPRPTAKREAVERGHSCHTRIKKVSTIFFKWVEPAL